MKKFVTAYFCGLLFALGLGISGMTRPPKILAFLNPFADWDPTLLVVFVVATGVYLISYRWILGVTVTGELEAALKGKEKMEPRVVFGALLFGIGWGWMGLCPGPALTDALSFKLPIYLFLFAMTAGMYLARFMPALNRK